MFRFCLHICSPGGFTDKKSVGDDETWTIPVGTVVWVTDGPLDESLLTVTGHLDERPHSEVEHVVKGISEGNYPSGPAGITKGINRLTVQDGGQVVVNGTLIMGS